MQTGEINVSTENIFPIIKKFLYSDHEIFLRELVSNGVDACQKLKTLSNVDELKGELGDLLVEVSIDKNASTITIKDSGIGMTGEEVEKYINQIAFSSAEEFVDKYKDKDGSSIIGHFGLGFYSAFMVADRVELITKTYKKGKGTKGVKWECDGSPNYSLEEYDKKERGTEIILHVADDSKEFLEDHRISELLNKYCKFLPVDIKFGTREEKIPTGEGEEAKEETFTVDNIINNSEPAWTKKPQDLKEDDYKGFYRELYPMTFDEPLFNIHLNVDYPFNLTGILYFPKLKDTVEVQKNKIQLYCNQVFVTDSVEGIVPDFLTLLHGVIDSPDIPLNVSRSYLQSDGNVKKISGHISKKVADKLEELFKKDRKDFESKWNDIKVFIEYGIISEEKFYDRAGKFTLLKNVDNEFSTLEEYAEKVKKVQTDKDNKVIYLYASNPDEQYSYIQSAKDRGYDVLLFDHPIDSHFIGFLESKLENTSFVRVDSDTIDKLINKEDAQPSKLTEDQQNELKPVFEGQVEQGKFTILFENLSESDNPIVITQPEFARRMKDMSMLGGGMNMMGTMPEMYNMVVNSNHPLVSKILDEKKDDKKNSLAKQAVDLALLSQGMLKGEDLNKFINRSIDLID